MKKIFFTLIAFIVAIVASAQEKIIKVYEYDDRGELYLALYHLATKIFPNTYFRSMFEDPNSFMSGLYIKKDMMQ